VQAQSSSSSSGGNAPRIDTDGNPGARPRAAQLHDGGASVTLETSEPLFQLATALNVCGYDADLESSLPARAEIRAELNETLASSEAARNSRDALCQYIRAHRQADSGLDVGQYVSLSLYLSPPPELTPNVDETELPPQAAQVVNVLPLLRQFSTDANLHYFWIKHRAEYEAAVNRVHDPMTKMILDTNIFLHEPVSSYDGRRFLVLLEPMLSPTQTNARIYGSDYIIVTSPDNRAAGVPIRLDQIRHIYLHYVIEPFVYSRGTAMERIQPVLRGVSDAPLDFIYKSDAVALITECLIKAIEAKMFVLDNPPAKPHVHTREADMAYMDLKAAYDRSNDAERAKLVSIDETQGWVLTGYFYQALSVMGKNGDGLRDEIAPMIYGMDVGRELQHAREIQFSKTASVDPLRPHRQPHTIEGLDLAEMRLQQGHYDEAATIAEKAETDPKMDHGRATYLLARLDLIHGQADAALEGFTKTLGQTKDPRTLAWAHIYLGRLYDVMAEPHRDQAIIEYKLALANRDSAPDTKAAAEAGLKKPFTAPQRTGQAPQKATTDADGDKDFDPTGKAEKDAYKPEPAQK